jgi:copper chaperone CopZ
MKYITYTIDTSTCGDSSASDNARYAEAVKAAIKAEYPEAAVSVELSESVAPGHEADFDTINIDLRDIDDVRDNLNAIAAGVWERGTY